MQICRFVPCNFDSLLCQAAMARPFWCRTQPKCLEHGALLGHCWGVSLGQREQALRHEDHRHEQNGHQAEKGLPWTALYDPPTLPSMLWRSQFESPSRSFLAGSYGSQASASMVQDAINEVRVLSSLKHPYIVSQPESSKV